jgi:histidinol dehydrogenase
MSLRIIAANDRAALKGLYAGGWDAPASVRSTVAAILAEVKERGDEALLDYTRRFDAPDFAEGLLRVRIPPLDEARRFVPEEIAHGLELARERVATFHERQRPKDIEYRDADGTMSSFLSRPLAAIAAYVPSGSAPLPSSVIMTTVPARIAGVERIAVFSPPGRDGRINPATIFACSLCGAHELFAVGGAQAIAAAAYGTTSVAPVDKIVGPGNAWVTEAKRQVFGICGIDGLAGPSEVLVVADARANPEYVAGELLAQAEHDPLARVAAVSEDRALLERVAALLAQPSATQSDRGDIIVKVLAERTYLVHARDRAETLEVIERFAPEHLSLQIADARSLVPLIRRAGAIFVGDHTPVAAGDYIAGSNHVLPTSGAARFSSGLRTADFYRTMSVVENSRERMEHDALMLAALANFEGLSAHARTAEMRKGTKGMPKY